MPRIGIPALAVRAKAIDITLVHMRQHGFGRVRLGDVAKELGVSHVALYAHFADKAALLDAATERWLGEIATALSKICRSKRPPVEAIRAWFLELYRLKRQRILRDPEMYKAFDAATSCRKQFVTAHLETLNSQLLELVQKTDGELDGESARKMAISLFTATSAFHHPKLMLENYGEDCEQILSCIIDSLLDGLKLK